LTQIEEFGADLKNRRNGVAGESRGKRKGTANQREYTLMRRLAGSPRGRSSHFPDERRSALISGSPVSSGIRGLAVARKRPAATPQTRGDSTNFFDAHTNSLFPASSGGLAMILVDMMEIVDHPAD